MGKTTLLRAVIASTAGRPTFVANASPTARRIPLGALSGCLPPEVFLAGQGAPLLSHAAAHLRGAAPRGATLVVDDAHELDDESAVLVHHLTGSGHQLVGCVPSRDHMPDALSTLVRDDGIDVITLAPLTLDEVAEGVTQHLNGVVDAHSVEMLHDGSDGNPLLLRQLVERSVRDGSCRVVNGVWTIYSVPEMPSMIAEIEAKVASWPAELQRLAQAIAVLGSVDEATLRSVFPTSGDAHDDPLDGAVRLGIAEQSGGLFRLRSRSLATVLAGRSPRRERRIVLGAAISAAYDNPSVPVVIVASWLLRLAEFETLDPEIVLPIALRLFAIRRRDLVMRLLLACADLPAAGARLLAASLPTDGSTPTGTEAVSEALTEGVIESDASREAHVVIAEARGFVIVGGQHPDALVEKLQRSRCAPGIPETLKAQLEAWELNIRVAGGGPARSLGDRLLSLVREHPSDDAGSDAVHGAVSALHVMDRTDEVFELQRQVRNSIETDSAEAAIHRVSMAAVAAHHRRGDTHAVDRELSNLESAGESSILPAIYHLWVRGELELRRGRPTFAAAAFGALANRGVTLATFASHALRLCAAWTGVNEDDIADIGPIPPYGLVYKHKIGLLSCMLAIVRVELRSAFDQASVLVDAAAEDDQTLVAIEALLLCAVLAPSPGQAKRAYELLNDRGIGDEQDVAKVLVGLIQALVESDADALRILGEQLARADWTLAALLAFERSAEQFSLDGFRSKAADCRKRADALRSRGVRSPLVNIATSAVAGAPRLTVREAEIVAHARRGLSNRDVAVALGLSIRTVETHLQRSYVKLGVHDRDGLRVLHDSTDPGRAER
jgi:DNA-binding CsgD family transcriptional regulator